MVPWNGSRYVVVADPIAFGLVIDPVLSHCTVFCFHEQGQPLGNDRKSWSDELLGSLPNMYIYAANNPSESILAKRRGYGTLVSYNVPPYGR